MAETHQRYWIHTFSTEGSYGPFLVTTFLRFATPDRKNGAICLHTVQIHRRHVENKGKILTRIFLLEFSWTKRSSAKFSWRRRGVKFRSMGGFDVDVIAEVEWSDFSKATNFFLRTMSWVIMRTPIPKAVECGDNVSLAMIVLPTSLKNSSFLPSLSACVNMGMFVIVSNSCHNSLNASFFFFLRRTRPLTAIYILYMGGVCVQVTHCRMDTS